MNVGIDARMYGPNVGGGGLGRYVEQLVNELQSMTQANRYVLFLKQQNLDACRVRNPQFEKRLADIHWYGWKEQLVLPRLIDQEKLDLIHFPHWNVPLSIRTPFVVTIHDLILLEEPRSAKITTRNPLLFQMKQIGFHHVLRHAIEKSKKIIAVSAYTKQSILKHFPNIQPDKIKVIYEGVMEFGGSGLVARSLGTIPNSEPPATSPYLLTVGNAYPHKNLEALLHAFSLFHKRHPDIDLVLAGRNDVFYKRLRDQLKQIDIPSERVRFVANPTDSELRDLYRNAALYVFPSRIEGFGLPGLEAMREGVAVASSNAGSLPEILGDAAAYFPPDNVERMAEVIEQVLTDKTLRDKLIKKGHERITHFSWKTMAEQICQLYEEVHLG